MATVSYRLEDLKKAIVGIGYVGENDHMHVLIDCKEVFDEYPDAVPTMAIVPPVGEGYPKAVTRNGDVVEWLVKDSDVTVEGDGEFQLSFTEGEIIRKSINARFRVKRSISGSGSAPSGVQDWLTDANEKLAEVEEATRDAEEAAQHAPMIGLDGYWYRWDAEAEEYVNTGTKAQGDPGDLIDDTDPALNKTFSSSKIDEMNSQLLNAIDGVSDDVDDLLDHETYSGSGEPEIEYEPVTENNHINDSRLLINGYNSAIISYPSDATVRVYPVENGKTYKVKGRCDNTKNRPLLIVANNAVTDSTIALEGEYEYVLGTSSTQGIEEKEYTVSRTGFLYISASTNECGVWLKKAITPTERKYHIDDVMKDVSDIKGNVGLLNNAVLNKKVDSGSSAVKNVPRNADSIARVTSIDESVTLVRSIIGRNIANVTNVGDVVVDGEGTVKKGFRTVHLPAGNYYIILGNVGIYTMVNRVENGIYTTLYKDQFPMRLTITDPAGGYFIVYASSIANLGDLSGVMIGRLMDDENTLSFEAYSEKTYTPEDLEEDNRIEVIPYGFIEFVNSNGASSVEYAVTGKDDDTTTRKDFIISPDGSKFLPIVKDDGSIVGARVVPKKALFIGNSLTSGWQTFGEAATESDKDFVGRFGAVVADLDSNYTFNRKWSTQFEQQTSLANAQAWVTTNIDPLLSSDLDLIVVQLCENAVDNASAVVTFPESSLWLMKHLRTECPKARVVWMGLWFERRWVKTLLENTAKAGVEYIDIRPLYKPENVSAIGTVYKMESDYTKQYDVDSFTVSGGAIAMTFTVDDVQYTATIPSYTSYTSSSDTSITVTGIYHVVNTYYASIHPGDEGFRKIANKMLFDLGISDSEETIPADV